MKFLQEFCTPKIVKIGSFLTELVLKLKHISCITFFTHSVYIMYFDALHVKYVIVVILLIL